MTARADSGSRLARAGLVAAVVSRLFGRVVGILLIVLIARKAGDDTVATYGYLLGTATLVSTLTDLGVAAVAGREVAAGRLPAGGALWAALPLQALSVGAAVLITWLLCTLLGPAGIPGTALLLTMAFVVVTGFVGLWGELLRGSGRVYLEGALQMGSALALVVGGVLVTQAGGDATDLLVVVVGKEVVVLAISCALLRPQRTDAIRRRTLLGQSLWVAVAGTVLVLLWRQGTIIAGTGSITVLAVYVVASRYLDALVTVAHTAGIGLVPGMSALSTDPVRLRVAVRSYLRLAIVVGVAVAVVGSLAARPLTLVPFGNRWEEAIPAVRAFALMTLPVLLAFVTWPALLARHQVRLAAGACTAAALSGIGVTLVLFHASPSATAPAVGTGLGATVLALVMLYGIRDLLWGPAPRASAVDGTAVDGTAADVTVADVTSADASLSRSVSPPA